MFILQSQSKGQQLCEILHPREKFAEEKYGPIRSEGVPVEHLHKVFASPVV